MGGAIKIQTHKYTRKSTHTQKYTHKYTHTSTHTHTNRYAVCMHADMPDTWHTRMKQKDRKTEDEAQAKQ